MSHDQQYLFQTRLKTNFSADRELRSIMTEMRKLTEIGRNDKMTEIDRNDRNDKNDRN